AGTEDIYRGRAAASRPNDTRSHQGLGIHGRTGFESGLQSGDIHHHRAHALGIDRLSAIDAVAAKLRQLFDLLAHLRTSRVTGPGSLALMSATGHHAALATAADASGRLAVRGSFELM